MKILMLVNWKIEYCDNVPADKPPPDYCIAGQPYWFFRYFPVDVKADVIDVHSFPALEKFEKNVIRFYIWQTLKVLFQLKNYDVILSHGMQSGIVLCLLRRLFGKGKYKHIVIDVGGFNSAKESGRALKLMQFASKSLDGMIYHTRSQEMYYQKYYPWVMPKANFVLFGTDTEFHASTAGANGSNTEFHASTLDANGSASNPYILSIGYQKRDWETLFSAFNSLSTDIHLRVIGNKEAAKDMPNVDKRIEIIPPMPIKKLNAQINDALFCVLPLENFNYSYGQMTLLQQMAMQKAVIAADVPSIREYNVNDALITYEAGNVSDLAEKMRDLLENPGKISETGKKALNAVTELFTEQIMAAEIYSFLKEVS